MTGEWVAANLLEGEAHGLLARLEAVRSFSTTVPAVPAAAIADKSMLAIDRYLTTGRQILWEKVHEYLRWLRGPGCQEPVERQQRKLTLLRLQFNAVLDQLDIFADALTQRSEHENGIWLAGLDVLAADALALGEPYVTAPPVITYLDRGQGAAIRRARTRLPGGGASPVALIRVPRERMVGGGIGASLIHEVGHQAAALLDLTNTLGRTLHTREQRAAGDKPAWALWRRWISEIVADVWALGHLGVGGTLGLMGVVSLPRPFVFRVEMGDPHPCPWIRVKLSCVVGRLLYRDPQWDCVEAFWEEAYPPSALPPERRTLFALLEATAPELASIIANHAPPSLRGRRFGAVLPVGERTPSELRRRFIEWQRRPALMCGERPTLVLATLGQARFDGRLSAQDESSALTRLLNRWAVERSLPRDGALIDCRHAAARLTAA